MSEARLTSKGQTTISADIRKALGLSSDALVVFTRLDDGTTVMRNKTRSIIDLNGLLKPALSKPNVTVDDMNIGQS